MSREESDETHQETDSATEVKIPDREYYSLSSLTLALSQGVAN